MIKNYETPSIEVINYESEILTAETSPSIVIPFPWADENETDFFA